jgi:nitrogen fixation protein FixH
MTTNSGRPGFKMFCVSDIVGAIVLVVILASTGCSRKEPAPATQQPSSASASEASNSGWKLDLKVAPDHPRMVRPVTFSVHIADSAGKPVENAQLTGSLTMPLMDMGKTAVKFDSKGNGDYESTVPSFDMSGPWELTVDGSQGTFHAHQVFQVTVFD